MKLIVAFRNFANAPKNGMVLTDMDISCLFVLQHTVMEEPDVTLRMGGGIIWTCVYVRTPDACFLNFLSESKALRTLSRGVSLW